MSRHSNGYALPNIAPQQPVMNIAQPLNDTQLIALIAAQTPGPAADAVARATDIVFEAIKATPKLGQRIQEHMRKLAQENA